MAAIEKLIYQRSRIEDEVKLLQNRIRGSHHQPSLERVKEFEADLQHHYQEYRTVYTKLLSTLPVYRYDELDEDSLRFDALHTDACVLVETLLLSYPSTDNRTTQTPSPRSNRAPRWRTPRFRSRSPSRTSEQTVPNPDVVDKPSTSSLVKLLPFPFPPEEMKTSLILTKPRCREAQVTTVAQQKSPIPTCEKNPPYPTKTSQKDRCLANESFENVKCEFDVPPCEPSHASPDDDCVIADLKNENHRIPPPREEPVRDVPMADLFPSPPNEKKMNPISTNPFQAVEPPYEERSYQKPLNVFHIPPKAKPYRTVPQVPLEPKQFFLLREIPLINQPVLNITEASPAAERILTAKPAQILTGTSSVVDPPEKLWIIADPQFDPPPICVYGHFHADLKPKKPPDEQPLQSRPSETTPEYETQTHSSKESKEDVQHTTLPRSPTKSPTTPKISTHRKIPSSGCSYFDRSSFQPGGSMFAPKALR